MLRIVSFMLLLVFSLTFVGFYGYSIFRLVEIKAEMRAQLKLLPRNELKRISLTEHQYHRMKVGDDEIKVAGKMYDIASFELKKDSVILYALHDEAEDDLIAFLNTIIKRTTEDKKPFPESLLDLYSSLYLPVFFNFNAHHFQTHENESVYLFSSLLFHLRIQTPPPRCA
jgi:hypothetical protein